MEENLASSLKELLVERRGNRLGVSEIRRQLGEILNTQVQPEDLTDILKVMDADGLVQFNVSRECSLLFLCSCDCTAQELTPITHLVGEGTNRLCPCWCYWLEEKMLSLIFICLEWIYTRPMHGGVKGLISFSKRLNIYF